MARQPVSLANMLIHSKRSRVQSMENDLRTSLNYRLREAKRFVLTEDAALLVGQAIANYPEMIVDHGQFAIPPFENCWIEFPSQKFHNAIVPGSDKMVSDSTDTHVGYLFSNGRVYVGAVAGSGDADFSPFVMELNTPSSHASELEISQGLGVSRLMMDSLYWGTTMANNLPREIVRAFRAQHRISLSMTKTMQNAILAKNLGHDIIVGCAGEIRNIVGILLMMNQPKMIKYIGEKANYRATTHRGTQMHLGHSVIEINLERKPVSVLLSNPRGTHATPRLHDVMGNFAHRKVDRECEHYWEAEDDRHWTCANCHGRRWWRDGHKRGDASKGIITQERRLVYES